MNCSLPAIDKENERFPFCIVWSPLPGITTFFPFIGHVGIGDSRGNLYDFQGDFYIGENRMLFGKVVKYLDLRSVFIPALLSSKGSSKPIQEQVEQYDLVIHQVTRSFRQHQRYSFIRNNCHNFVACAINAQPQIQLSSKRWSVFQIAWKCMTKGKYVSKKLFFFTHFGTLVILCIIAFVLLIIMI